MKPAFRRRLRGWFDRHRRDLPWRGSRDPYRVWLSEIMLQQTRVAAVIEHYREFLQRFPTVEKLAAAREASVLAAWSGLGYYRRARMLHAAAKQIAGERAFPETSEGLRELPGIGRYTAAAIASIAFYEPVAVVDGNVERVLHRIFGKRLNGEECWGIAADLLDTRRPGDFNQAMMELGALVCTPRAPVCLTCPVIEWCATRGELQREGKPARQKKKEIHYALHRREGAVFLVQRARDASLMPGMWELPEMVGPTSGAEAFNMAGGTAALKALRHPKANRNGTPKRGSTKERAGARDGDSTRPSFTLRHSITVTDYTVRVWRAAAPSRVGGKWIPLDRLGQVPLTGLARKILRKAGVWPGLHGAEPDRLPNSL